MRVPAKKPTNLSVRRDLLEEARALDINLSSEFEKHLAEVVRQRRAERWLRDNREAIAAYNRYFEKYGAWSDGLRNF